MEDNRRGEGGWGVGGKKKRSESIKKKKISNHIKVLIRIIIRRRSVQ